MRVLFLNSTMLLFLAFISGFGYSQKANLETVETYCASGKYAEAYEILKSENFKYKDSEQGKYYYFTAFVCSSLYDQNKELNSPYRNEGIHYGADAMKSDIPEWQTRGKEIVVYLTSTIYKDVFDSEKAKSETDSVVFDAFSTETLLAFKEFIIPESWNDQDIYFLGSSFYNDSVYLLQTSSIDGESDEERDNKMRYYVLHFNAKKYFKILCNQYQLNCDILENLSQ